MTRAGVKRAQPEMIEQIDASRWLTQDEWRLREHEPVPSTWRIKHVTDKSVTLVATCQCGDSGCTWAAMSWKESLHPVRWQNYQPSWDYRKRAAKDPRIQLTRHLVQ